MADRMEIALYSLDTKDAKNVIADIQKEFGNVAENGKCRVLVKMTKTDGSVVYYRNGSDYCDSWDEKPEARSVFYWVDDFANLIRCADYYGKTFPVIEVVRVA